MIDMIETRFISYPANKDTTGITFISEIFISINNAITFAINA